MHHKRPILRDPRKNDRYFSLRGCIYIMYKQGYLPEKNVRVFPRTGQGSLSPALGWLVQGSKNLTVAIMEE